MKYLFFIQTEGRGHLSQALTLAKKLRNNGHEVVGAILSENPLRKIPDYFKEEISCPLHFIKSPYFLINKRGTGIDLGKSIFFNLSRSFIYAGSLKKIKSIYQKHNPDVTINFYEPLAGLYNLFYKPKVTSYSVGHQFFIEHPSFKKPSGYLSDSKYLVFYNSLTSYGSKTRLALSFTEEPDLPSKRLVVCPPLIRKEVTELEPRQENFILSYVLNPGYFKEIKDWAMSHPEEKVEAFWDKAGEEKSSYFGSNLAFHPISGQKFLDLLARCSTYISTAGFDSISEAAYLQKNILMVPTQNHYEQLCNATDAVRAGLAETDSYFNIDLAVQKQKTRQAYPGQVFRKWVDEQSDKILQIITN